VSKKILIVDNEKLIRKLHRAIIEHAGYEAIEAEDSKQGIQLAKEHIPNLILMDIQMPLMGGIEAVKILKSDPITKDIPVIAVTFVDEKVYKEKLLEQGFNDFISKPADIKDILNTIKSILGE
jgi:CheY-like chemotaxis protein